MCETAATPPPPPPYLCCYLVIFITQIWNTPLVGPYVKPMTHAYQPAHLCCLYHNEPPSPSYNGINTSFNTSLKVIWGLKSLNLYLPHSYADCPTQITPSCHQNWIVATPHPFPSIFYYLHKISYTFVLFLYPGSVLPPDTHKHISNNVVPLYLK